MAELRQIAIDGKRIKDAVESVEQKDIYTAGDNVSISDGVISATDTTYTAGDNISISGGVISATDTTYTAGDNIAISSGGAISVSSGANVSGKILTSNGSGGATWETPSSVSSLPLFNVDFTTGDLESVTSLSLSYMTAAGIQSQTIPENSHVILTGVNYIIVHGISGTLDSEILESDGVLWLSGLTDDNTHLYLLAHNDGYITYGMVL